MGAGGWVRIGAGVGFEWERDIGFGLERRLGSDWRGRWVRIVGRGPVRDRGRGGGRLGFAPAIGRRPGQAGPTRRPESVGAPASRFPGNIPWHAVPRPCKFDTLSLDAFMNARILPER
jgi:hypothetical protein